MWQPVLILWHTATNCWETLLRLRFSIVCSLLILQFHTKMVWYETKDRRCEHPCYVATESPQI